MIEISWATKDFSFDEVIFKVNQSFIVCTWILSRSRKENRWNFSFLALHYAPFSQSRLSFDRTGKLRSGKILKWEKLWFLCCLYWRSIRQLEAKRNVKRRRIIITLISFFSRKQELATWKLWQRSARQGLQSHQETKPSEDCFSITTRKLIFCRKRSPTHFRIWSFIRFTTVRSSKFSQPILRIWSIWKPWTCRTTKSRRSQTTCSTI